MESFSFNSQIAFVALTNVMAFVVGYLLQRSDPKAKIRFSNLPSPNYTIPSTKESEGSIYVQTRVFRVTNTGNIKADDVEAIFNYRPFHFSIVPPLNYQSYENPEGYFIIKFPRLNPKQETHITLLNIGKGEIPNIRDVVSEFGSAKFATVNFRPDPTKLQIFVVLFLMFAGICAIIYMVYYFIDWLIFLKAV